MSWCVATKIRSLLLGDRFQEENYGFQNRRGLAMFCYTTA